MTAYLKPGDRIMLAAPDFNPGNGLIDGHKMWQDVYTELGVTVVHVAVHHALSHPVVVAVFRGDANPVEGDPA